MVFELYNSSDSSSGDDQGGGNGSGNGTYFRLLYDGAPLLLPGCGDELCSTAILIDVLSFGQENMPCPSATESSSTDDDESGGRSSNGGSSCDDDDDSSLSSAGWAGIIIAVFVVGIVAGAIGSYVTLQYLAGAASSKSSAAANNAGSVTSGTGGTPLNNPLLDQI